LGTLSRFSLLLLHYVIFQTGRHQVIPIGGFLYKTDAGFGLLT